MVNFSIKTMSSGNGDMCHGTKKFQGPKLVKDFDGTGTEYYHKEDSQTIPVS